MDGRFPCTELAVGERPISTEAPPPAGCQSALTAWTLRDSGVEGCCFHVTGNDLLLKHPQHPDQHSVPHHSHAELFTQEAPFSVVVSKS
ncbi:hypothetical protein E2C01_040201 [Portunus trituberculatus]|uniref:Uncharacterized protein n=1 Tax=Portunus trituberculatus TaxID=210409 RepID=A0A5B7FFU9_PORTR|nr:hypothetical protein [Portunus trituberculatus]